MKSLYRLRSPLNLSKSENLSEKKSASSGEAFLPDRSPEGARGQRVDLQLLPSLFLRWSRPPPTPQQPSSRPTGTSYARSMRIGTSELPSYLRRSTDFQTVLLPPPLLRLPRRPKLSLSLNQLSTSLTFQRRREGSTRLTILLTGELDVLRCSRREQRRRKEESS